MNNPIKPRSPSLLRSFILFGILTGVTTARAEIRLPAILGDHMVFQQGKSAVWGKALPGKTITVSLAGVQATSTAKPDGSWITHLTLPKPGGPFKLVVSGDGAVTLTDVLIGDVWLGSGQSNMEFTLKRTHDASTQVPQADKPQMRLFTLEQRAGAIPFDDVKGTWKVCSPETAEGFSAIAYHFGNEIQKTLKVPVGLVVSAWGGTSAEAWVPREALDKDPRFGKILAEWDANEAQTKSWKEGYPYELRISDLRLVPKDKAAGAQKIALQSGGVGWGGAWNLSVKPDSTGDYKVQGIGPDGGRAAILSGLMKGGGWITLTTPLKPDNSAIDLSGFETVEFYAKGAGPYRMKLGQPSITDYNYHATDVFNAPGEWKLMRFPIASLRQGFWGTPKVFTPGSIHSLIFTAEAPYCPDVAGVVYNAMVAPLASFGLKGVIWYQGESNAGRSDEYAPLLTALIQSWRAAWGKDLPFLIVQLPNFMQVKPQPSESGWAGLREAQRTVLAVPGTALVTTVDLGEAGDIHPKNKTDVGKRTALAALGKVYGKPVVSSGPLFDTAVIQDGKVTVTFQEAGAGLSTRDDKPVTGFAIADEEGDYVWAEAKITGTKTLEVWNRAVKAPAAVRYAWADNPVCNLVNKEGLPASPFQYGTIPEIVETGRPSFEPWKSTDGAGVYADSKGSSLSFAFEKGPKKGQRAVHLTYDLKADGHCGLWRNVSYDLTKAKRIVFMARTTQPGDVQVALKDKWNVQYIAIATLRSAYWEEVVLDLSDFKKDPYYTPPNAELGNPMDFTKVNSMNFGPQTKGKGEIWIGPVWKE